MRAANQSFGPELSVGSVNCNSYHFREAIRADVTTDFRYNTWALFIIPTAAERAQTR